MANSSKERKEVVTTPSPDTTTGATREGASLLAWGGIKGEFAMGRSKW